MKLRAFITDALIEVQHGVEDAIKRRDELGLLGRISPAFRAPDVDWTKNLQQVEFDVAVTESSSSSVAGEGGLDIVIGKLDTKATKTAEHSAINRIKFSVPVLFAGQLTDPK